MFIVWKGKGIFVLLIFGATLALHYLLFAEEGNTKIFQGYGPTTAFLVTGISCFLLAASWKAKGQVYFDPKKNKETTARPGHSFYGINVYYWSYILTAAGLLCLYYQLK